jgi:hypothetical protein
MARTQSEQPRSEIEVLHANPATRDEDAPHRARG